MKSYWAAICWPSNPRKMLTLINPFNRLQPFTAYDSGMKLAVSTYYDFFKFQTYSAQIYLSPKQMMITWPNMVQQVEQVPSRRLPWQ